MTERLTEDVRRVLLAQSGYYVATGILPFVSRRLFEAVTGPKRDWWLVQTVGGLVTVVGAGLGAAALRRQASPELLGVAAGCALVLAGIDVIHVRRGRIPATYLADAGIELGLVVLLAVGVRRARRAR